MQPNRLILYPTEPASAVADAGALGEHLGRIGFCGDRFAADGETYWLTGPAFLRQVTFLGCSPAIELEPPGTLPAPAWGRLRNDFCHIHISAPHAQARFLHAGNTVKPACPHCREKLGNLPGENGAVQCSQCGKHWPAAELNWRRTACMCRMQISVYGIYPSEAIPTDGLLAQLQDITGFSWKYAYLQGGSSPQVALS